MISYQMFVYMSRAMKNKLMVFVSISYLWCISKLYFIRCFLVSANTKPNSISIFHNIQNKMEPFYHSKFEEKFIFFSHFSMNKHLMKIWLDARQRAIQHHFFHLMDIRVGSMLSQSQNQTNLVKALRQTSCLRYSTKSSWLSTSFEFCIIHLHLVLLFRNHVL